MTDPTPKQLAMARRIAHEVVPDGLNSNLPMRLVMREIAAQSALAAIIETSERIERMLDKCNDPCPQCWEAFSKGDHLDD